MGDDSGTGVAFTRDPATGENVFYGEFLINAQGEDVVAGVRTPEPVAELKKQMPGAYKELERIRQTLERNFGDVQDFEFTIEDQVVYMLQTRNGKRTAMAALKIAIDMVKEKLMTGRRGDAQPGRPARSAAGADLRRRRDGRGGADGDRPACRPRRGVRPDRPERGPRGHGRREGPARPARPHRDQAGRSARHDRGRRHPHRPRRRVQPRGAGRPADGQGLRLRRRRHRDRLQRRHAQRQRPDLQGRRLDVDQRHHRRGLRRRAQDRADRDHRRPGAQRRGRQGHREVPSLPAADEVVLAGGADVGAHQCRQPEQTEAASRSAPTASACAAPSTCSSRATASTRCGR